MKTVVDCREQQGVLYHHFWSHKALHAVTSMALFIISQLRKIRAFLVFERFLFHAALNQRPAALQYVVRWSILDIMYLSRFSPSLAAAEDTFIQAD